MDDQASQEDTDDLRARADSEMESIRDRIRRVTPQPRGSRAPSSPSRIRMRTLILPAFAILIMIQFGSRAGAPLGVQAAFTPGEGSSFAGPTVFEVRPGSAPQESVSISPGDLVGARSGSDSVLVLGEGRLRLEPGARALIGAILPPRVRLLGGHAEASGRIRVVTAHGILDLAEGKASVRLNESGFHVTLTEGEGTLLGPDGAVTLQPWVQATTL